MAYSRLWSLILFVCKTVCMYRVTHKELDCKDDTRYMTISSLIFGFCIQFSILMVYQIIKHRNYPVLAYKEPWNQENGLNNFRTIVFKVSIFKNFSIILSSHFNYHTLPVIPFNKKKLSLNFAIEISFVISSSFVMFEWRPGNQIN